MLPSLAMTVTTIAAWTIVAGGIWLVLGAAGFFRTATDPAYEKQSRILTGILGVILILLGASTGESR
jgi:hypothetical protein